MSSHPSSAKSSRFLLPIGSLQQQKSLSRDGFDELALGVYKHWWWLILAIRRHHIIFQVLKSGQWLSGGSQMIVNLHKCQKFEYVVRGNTNAVAKVRKVTRRFWRSYVMWVGQWNIYMGFEKLSWSDHTIFAAIQVENDIVGIIHEPWFIHHIYKLITKTTKSMLCNPISLLSQAVVHVPCDEVARSVSKEDSRFMYGRNIT